MHGNCQIIEWKLDGKFSSRDSAFHLLCRLIEHIVSPSRLFHAGVDGNNSPHLSLVQYVCQFQFQFEMKLKSFYCFCVLLSIKLTYKLNLIHFLYIFLSIFFFREKHYRKWKICVFWDQSKVENCPTVTEALHYPHIEHTRVIIMCLMKNKHILSYSCIIITMRMKTV